jgi:hypothetical protein
LATKQPPFPSAVYSDADGDGILDWVGIYSRVPGPEESTVFSLHGNGDGTFVVDKPSWSVVVEGIPGRPVKGDFNGDGRSDLLVSLGSKEALRVLVYAQTGSSYALLGSLDGMWCQRAVDFNGDGRTDALCDVFPGLNQASNGFVVVRSKPDGSFDVSEPFTLDPLWALNWFAVLSSKSNPAQALAFSGLIVTAPGGAAPKVNTSAPSFFYAIAADILGQGSSQLLGAGQGTSSLQVHAMAADFATTSQAGVVTLPVPMDLSFNRLEAADVNVDGRVDLVSTGNAGFHVFRQHVDGTFVQAFHLDYNPGDVAVVDLNGDGLPDIVSCRGQGIQVYLNTSH